MRPRREQALVGLFVLIAASLLVATIFGISGTFGGTAKTFHAYFSFAGGLEPGATVRYAGGPRVGRVENVHIDPQNPARVDIVVSVRSEVPVKTDSHLKIMSISPLGDNHIEILPGTQQAALAAVGALLPSDPYIDFNALTAQINDIAPQVKNLLRNLNDRAADLKVTIDRVNSLLSNENRANLSATLADTRGLIEENRPQLRATLQHINTVSEKLEPLLQDFQKTSKQANETLDHFDAMVGENRADVRQAVIELRKTLTTMTDLTGRLDQTLEVNSDNLDEVLDNLRHVTENLKQFTDTIKKRPYTLIRSSNPPEHKTGEKQ
jgi:phospholipid/cholesterol/gamma-HCH transport system substrate-binding protein